MSSDRKAAQRGSGSSTVAVARQWRCGRRRSSGRCPAQSSAHSGAGGSSSSERVAHERREVEGVVVERVGLALERRGSKSSSTWTAISPATGWRQRLHGAVPRSVHRSPRDDDAVGDLFQRADRTRTGSVGRHLRDAVAEVGPRPATSTSRDGAGPAEQVGDRDAQRVGWSGGLGTRNSSRSLAKRGRRKASPRSWMPPDRSRSGAARTAATPRLGPGGEIAAPIVPGRMRRHAVRTRRGQASSWSKNPPSRRRPRPRAVSRRDVDLEAFAALLHLLHGAVEHHLERGELAVDVVLGLVADLAPPAVAVLDDRLPRSGAPRARPRCVRPSARRAPGPPR